MAVEPDEIGSPDGKPKSAKELREAVRLVVAGSSEDFERLADHPPAQPKILEALALVRRGLAGDVQALRDIGYRLDGEALDIDVRIL